MNKFEFPCACTYKGEDHVITTRQKDFSTKKMYYYLKGITNRIPVEEVLISKNTSGNVSAELLELRTAYAGIFGKEVPTNKKNNAKWIQNKIDELPIPVKEITSTKIMAMALPELEALIVEKELEIDIEDYILTDEPENMSYLQEEVVIQLGFELPE